MGFDRVGLDSYSPEVKDTSSGSTPYVSINDSRVSVANRRQRPMVNCQRTTHHCNTKFKICDVTNANQSSCNNSAYNNKVDCEFSESVWTALFNGSNIDCNDEHYLLPKAISFQPSYFLLI